MLPILFRSNGIVFYSYPLLMGLGWGVAYQIFFDLLPEAFTRKRAQILFWGLFAFSWVGAKVFFLYTVPRDLSANLLQDSSFWLGGGFVFYGGFLGGLFYLLILRALRFPVSREVLWAMVPALTIGHAIGRIGCLLAGCCYGKQTDLFWGIYLHGTHRHPTQIIEAVLLLALGIYLLRSRMPKTYLVSTYLLSYGAIRLLGEALRGDLIRGQWGPLTPSQWVSVVLLMTGLVLLKKANYSKRL